MKCLSGIPSDFRAIVHVCVVFLNQIDTDKIERLCNAVSTDEKRFWKFLKGQRSSSQMSSFLVDDKLITDKKQVCEMWADHSNSPICTSLFTPKTGGLQCSNRL